MKKLSLIPALGMSLLLILTFVSCKKKGCMDNDADNYSSSAEKSDGSCMYRYASAVEISAPSSINYDPFDAPDLYIRYAKSNSANWDYVSNTGSNSYFENFTLTPDKFTNEDWVFEVYDYDSIDPDDLILTGTFNPVTDGGDGNITITNSNGVSVSFKYLRK